VKINRYSNLGEEDMIDKIRNWFILSFFIILIMGSLQVLLGQTKTKEEGMSEEKKYSEEECHRRFAVKLNNLVWTLLDKEDKTAQEDEEMIHAAHASLSHWSVVGKAVNLQRGQWMVSHVYSVLNRPEPALYHAKKCMGLTHAHNFVDFDLAYAYEAMARANACSGNKSEYRKYIKLAEEAGEKIKKKEDKKLFFGDLEKEPWFNMK